MHNRNANALRMLAIDAVERANSGHPGAVMGMADIATVLWKHFIRHDPNNPTLPNRDRVILSNGHASMMLYGALHLMGYTKFTLDSLKNFRQLGSLTTGHPEYDAHIGVEYTTGPLGQGLAGAVGMALGERLCAAQYNKEGYPLFDNYTYAFVGDGCLMEGISHEACSLAGTLGLNKLIVLYDSNGISIDGEVTPWFSENTAMRFRSYGWNVIEGVDGHNQDEIYVSIEKAKSYKNAPTLICYTTVIGYGSPHKAGTAKAHGSPLGKEEVKAVREAYNWEYDEFIIPNDVYDYWNAEKTGREHTKYYQALCDEYKEQFPTEWAEIEQRRSGEYSEAFYNSIAQAKEYAQNMTQGQATRIASHDILQMILPTLPQLVGGSADLTPSVGTYTVSSTHITSEDASGNYISYGVREFGMYAIMNGLSLYEGYIPYGGTFFVFADYAKPALRLSAMMQNHVIWVFTHDSIGVGEDGPTHQPIEHLTMLRSMPHVTVWRPADTMETVYAWEYAITHNNGPTALILSRQVLPQVDRKSGFHENIAYGGYILYDAENPEVILLATGSELQLAIEAYTVLSKQGKRVRLVSMPSTTLFDAAPSEYQKSVLLEGLPLVVIEASEGLSWYKYMKYGGEIVSMQGYGASGKGEELFTYFGFHVEAIIAAVNRVLE